MACLFSDFGSVTVYGGLPSVHFVLGFCCARHFLTRITEVNSSRFWVRFCLLFLCFSCYGLTWEGSTSSLCQLVVFHETGAWTPPTFSGRCFAAWTIETIILQIQWKSGLWRILQTPLFCSNMMTHLSTVLNIRSESVLLFRAPV